MKHLIKGYGSLLLSIPLFLFIIIYNLIIPFPVVAKDDVYLDELLQDAKGKQIYNDRYWDVLLHYKPAIYSKTGRKSLIDSPAFFLSPDGKKDPESELIATIKSFFTEDVLDDNHPKCRFIARYTWLKHVLNIDETRLPVETCKEFNDAISRINPKKAVFIFPVGYMDSPASMFGHTLLRIDSTYQSKLISYAANYAAYADDKNGFVYAFKGVFGYYLGYFTILPYYEKVKEYNELEQRDIWEYKLDLSEEEVNKIVMHLWELKDIYSYYYFFDENCSYNLLYLLEAARPSLNLTDKFHGSVLPIDTIRAVLDSGIVESSEYRPAKATKIKYIASLMDEESRGLCLKVINKEIKPEEINVAGQDGKIKILDLCAEVLQYDYGKKRMTKDEYQKQFLSILTERSKLGNTGEGLYRIPVPENPEKGHRPGLLGMSAGIKRDKPFYELRYRSSYHELTDFDDGFIEGSQIVFFNTAVRYYSEDNRVRLKDLDIVDIVSLSPRSEFFKSTSWKVRTGFTRKTFSNGKEYLVYHLSPGGGFAFKNNLTGLSYGMFETSLNTAGPLEDSYAVGFGASVGTLRLITDYYKVNVLLKGMSYPFGEKHRLYEAKIIQSFKINQNNSINLNVTGEKVSDVNQTEVTFVWNYYF